MGQSQQQGSKFRPGNLLLRRKNQTVPADALHQLLAVSLMHGFQRPGRNQVLVGEHRPTGHPGRRNAEQVPFACQVTVISGQCQQRLLGGYAVSRLSLGMGISPVRLTEGSQMAEQSAFGFDKPRVIRADTRCSQGNDDLRCALTVFYTCLLVAAVFLLLLRQPGDGFVCCRCNRCLTGMS
ncbi:hypothetical protein D3C74_328500 [compost metagenome]